MRKEFANSLLKHCKEVIHQCVPCFECQKQSRSRHIFRKEDHDANLYFFICVESGKYDYEIDVRICWSRIDVLPKKMIEDGRAMDIMGEEIELESYWVPLGRLANNKSESYEVKSSPLTSIEFIESLDTISEIESDMLVLAQLRIISDDLIRSALPYISWVSERVRC